MPRRIGLCFDEWPTQDRAVWSAAFSTATLLDEPGPAATWRPKTVADAKSEYGRWLAFLASSDAAVLALGPAERVTDSAVREYVALLSARIAPVSVAAALGHLVLALRAVAPATKWFWLRRVQRKIATRAVPRDKRWRMVSAHQLYELGLQLMGDAEFAGTRGERFRRYRDGLLIALLCSRPLRRGNIAGLHLDRNMMVVSSTVRLHFTASEMKNGRPHEAWAPEALTAPLLTYVGDLRGRLQHAMSHDAVWCSSNGRPLTADAIYHAILRRTQSAFGVAINMHLFRDIAATAIAIDAPEQSRLARDLLGHTNLNTTERHYLQAQTQIAGAHYVRLTDSLRSTESE